MCSVECGFLNQLLIAMARGLPGAMALPQVHAGGKGSRGLPFGVAQLVPNSHSRLEVENPANITGFPTFLLNGAGCSNAATPVKGRRVRP